MGTTIASHWCPTSRCSFSVSYQRFLAACVLALLGRGRWAFLLLACLPLLWAASTVRAVAQNPVCGTSSYCLEYYYQASTSVPSTSLGGGGDIDLIWGSGNPPTDIYQVQQLNFNLGPPVLNTQSVTAVDPCGNDLLSVNASAEIYTQSIQPGVLSEWLGTSGGTADSNCVNVQIAANGVLFWTDELAVGGLPSGTPVTLALTLDVSGYCRVSPPLPPTESPACYTIFAIGGIDQQLFAEPSGSMGSHHVYRLKTTSGAQLNLIQQIQGYYNGGGVAQWTFAVDGTAVTRVDVVTAGAVVTGANGVTYPTSANLIAVPAVASKTQGTAIVDLQNAGLVIGTISNAPSEAVAAGVVIDSSPPAGALVPSMFPVNLVVSDGRPPKPAAADVSTLVSVSLSGFEYNKVSELYRQTVTVTNTSAQSIPGPINVVVETLSADASVHNSAGTTSWFAPGSPYVTKAGPLASGQSVTIPIQFSDPTKQAITWITEVNAGGAP